MNLIDPKLEVLEAARLIRMALTALGFCHQTAAGGLWEISFKSLGVVSDQYGLIEVDTHRLPRKVTIAKLTSKETLHHLTAVVGKPVKRLNTTGLTYCVVLQPKPKVRLPKLVRLNFDRRPPGDYLIPIGRGRKGDVWRSLLKTGHILVGGETESGKTTFIHACLAALLVTYGPDQLVLTIIDPKEVDFAPYSGIDHLAVPIAFEVDEAQEVTAWLIEELDRRRRLFLRVLAKNLAAYNQRAEEPLPLVLAIIDEVTDIALQAGLTSQFYKDLIRLASKSAAFGIRLILATQNPKAEVLNTLIRGNLSTRIAFRVATSEHSRTILGVSGAETIPRTIRGRMKAMVGAEVEELQGFFVSEEEILAITKRCGGRGEKRLKLSDLEQDLVRYALDYLNGCFTINKLTEAFAGRTTHYQIQTLGQRWERLGLLTRPTHATDSRKITPALENLLGETPKII